MYNYFKFINNKKIGYNFELLEKFEKNTNYSKNDILLLCEEFEKENINCNFLKDVDPMELASYLVSSFQKKEFIKYGNYISLLFLLNEFYINQEEYIIDSCDQIFDECLSILKGNNYKHEFLLTKYLSNLANGSSERFKSQLMDFFSKTKNEKRIIQNNESINVNDFIEQRKVTSGAVLVIELLFELIQETSILEQNQVNNIYNLAVETVWRLNDIFLFQDEKLKPNILNFEFEKEDKNNILQSRTDILSQSIIKYFNNFLEKTQKYCQKYPQNNNAIKLLEDLVVGYLYFQLESGRYGILKSNKSHQQISNEIKEYLEFYGAKAPENIYTLCNSTKNQESNGFLLSHVQFNPDNWILKENNIPLCSPITFSQIVLQGKTPGKLKTGALFSWFFSQYSLCLEKHMKLTDTKCDFPTCFDSSNLFNIKTIESIIIESLKPIRKEINKRSYYVLKEKIILAFYRFIISRFILNYYGKKNKQLNLVASAFQNGEEIFLSFASEFNSFSSYKKNIDLFIASILLLSGRENNSLFNFKKPLNIYPIHWDRENIYHEHYLLDTQILYEDQMMYIRKNKMKKKIPDENITLHINFLLKWNEELRTFRENNIRKDNSYYYQLNRIKKPIIVKNKNYYKNLEIIEDAKKSVVKFLYLPKNILEKCIENICSEYFVLNWILQNL